MGGGVAHVRRDSAPTDGSQEPVFSQGLGPGTGRSDVGCSLVANERSRMARKSFEVIDVTEILTYWYAGRPKAGGIERYVTLEEPNDADHHAIDDAYRT